MTPKPTPVPTTTDKPAKTTSPAILAARAFNRIATIDEEEADELKQSPEAIRKKHADRRAKAREALSTEARVILDGMLAAKASAKGAAE